MGPLEVRADESPIPLTAAKQKAILALLLLHRDETVSVDLLKEALWGDSPPTTAGTALQGYVSQLRRALESGVEGGAGLLVTSAPGYSLTAAPEQVDLSRFEQLAARGREALGAGESDRAAGLMGEALGLWRGPPLADFSYENWAQAPIGRLEELRVSALEDRVEADLRCGRHGELVGELESLVAEQPLRERLRGQLMLALYRGGRQADALEVYQAARRTLVEELGIEPSSELQSLTHSILNQDEALAAPPRVATASGVSVNESNLPVQATPLIGRELELEQLHTIVREARLLTLSGAGGSGKTRLALQLATELVEQFQDGVCWVPLAALRDPELVPVALAEALALREQPGRSLVETLADELAPKRVLLLLDNFEHLLEAAPLLAELLSTCSELRLLVTSRAPLRLGAEHEFEVEPLPEHDAVSLFGERARQIKPGFAPNGVVVEICRRLDGLPLAIELAAARVRVLPPPLLLERLEQRLPLLTGGARDAPERQKTLAATIAWSDELLSAEERRLFARLSVFAGGFSLEAAEDICAAELDALSSLVEQSMLRRTVEGRFLLLATIREYALERLEESGEADEVRRRHAEHFLALAETAEPQLRGSEQARWLERLEAELANLRAALRWADRARQAELGLRLSSALDRFWWLRGHLSEGRSFLEAALARGGAAPAGLRARALDGASHIAFRLGDHEPAQAYVEEGIALAREAGERRELTGYLVTLALILHARGDYEGAQRNLEESLALAREFADARMLSTATGNLGEVALARGQYEQARAYFEEVIEYDRATGVRSDLAIALFNAALVDLNLDRWQAAVPNLVETLEICRELQMPEGFAYCLEAFAAVAAARGDAEAAARLLGAAASRLEESESPLGPSEQTVHERTLEHVRAALDETTISELHSEGRSLPADEAFAYALEAAGE